MKYVCELCGTVYDEALGDPSRGVPAGTPFDVLREDYECPNCGSAKEAFCKAEKKPLPRMGCAVDGDLWREAKYSADQSESQR